MAIRSKKMIFIVAFSAGAILCIALLAWFVQSSLNSLSTEQPLTKEERQENFKAVNEGRRHYLPGETANLLDTFEVTVDKVNLDFKPTPQKNEEITGTFVAVDVTVKNTTKSLRNITRSSFFLGGNGVTDAGAVAEYSNFGPSDGRIALAGNSTKSATLVFRAGENPSNLKLRFESTIRDGENNQSAVRYTIAIK